MDNLDVKLKKSYEVGTEAALMSVMQGHNTFITGPGGSGKSHLIDTLRTLFPDDTLLVGPTGVSALNIKGMSCHRAFGLSFGVTQDKDLTEVKSKKQAELLSSKALERLIIDEVSMVRSDKLYEMDQKLRYLRKNEKPFGGLQVIVLGDGFQMLPVLTQQEEAMFREMYGSEIPFGSYSWEQCDFKNVILLEVHRQKDPEFARVLGDLRMGRNVQQGVAFINSRCHKPPTNTSAITLTGTNKLADVINEREFAKVPGVARDFKAQVRGDFKDRPVPELMKLKLGIKVMITANDTPKEGEEAKYVNGSVGFIRSMNDAFLIVDINGVEVRVPPKEWKNIIYEVRKERRPKLQDNGQPLLDDDGKPVMEIKSVVKEKEVGSYTAFPVKLGWAITSHKAQGLTLDAVNVDLGYGAFTPGQAYVAASRATSTEALRMLKPLKARDIIVDQRIVKFYQDTFPGT